MEIVVTVTGTKSDGFCSLVLLCRYVMKLVKNFDEAFKNMASGMDMRPTTRTTP